MAQTIYNQYSKCTRLFRWWPPNKHLGLYLSTFSVGWALRFALVNGYQLANAQILDKCFHIGACFFKRIPLGMKLPNYEKSQNILLWEVHIGRPWGMRHYIEQESSRRRNSVSQLIPQLNANMQAIPIHDRRIAQSPES